MNVAGQKILFVVSEDWYFSLHWLNLARAARNAGFCVGVATKLTGSAPPTFLAEGFEIFPLESFSRRGLNPLRELAAIRELVKIYSAFKPDLVHHFVVKTCLVGTVAARWSGVPLILNANTGGGFVYTGQSVWRQTLRKTITKLFQLVFRSPRVHILLLNDADRLEFSALWRVPLDRAWAVLGVPIDLSRFKAIPEPTGTPTLLFAGRMLRDKGLPELLTAASALREQGVNFRLILAGEEDPGNPASLTSVELQALEDSGMIEWRRRESDMPTLYSQSHIVLLPSYREGLGAVLIEGGACGRASIASNIPGCRDVVRDGETGILVSPRDVRALVEAIRLLIIDAPLRQRLGQAAIHHVERNFALPVVLARYLALYRKLLGLEFTSAGSQAASAEPSEPAAGRV